MPKYGGHTFLWIDEWTTEKGNRAIAATGVIGFDFIEISLSKPDEFDVAAHKKALAAAGIEATGSLVLPEWAHCLASIIQVPASSLLLPLSPLFHLSIIPVFLLSDECVTSLHLLEEQFTKRW